MQRNLGLDGFGHRVSMSEAKEAWVITAERVADQVKAMRRGVRRLVEHGMVEPSVLEPGADGERAAEGLVRRVRRGRTVVDADFYLPPTRWMVDHARAANARRKLMRVSPDRSLGFIVA